MGSWDSSGMVMSPFAPDMHSIASGSFINNNPNSSSILNSGPRSVGSSYDYTGSGGGPLSQLADSVNSLDPLSSIEKTINEQVGMPAPPSFRDSGNNGPNSVGSNHNNQQPHTPQTGPNTPHTPHTPGSVHAPHTPAGGPPSVGNPHHMNNNNSSNASSGNHSNSSSGATTPAMNVKNEMSSIPDTTTSDSGLPSDLNFDPEAVINGEGSGNESLNVRFIVGKMEIVFEDTYRIGSVMLIRSEIR